MAVELATAYISLVPSLKGAQGAIADQLSTEGVPAGKKVGGGIVTGLKGAIAPVAGIMAGAFAAGAVVNWGKTAIQHLGEVEALNAQTAAAITSTGGAAGVTAEHVAELSGRLSNLTATEDESIQSGANMLLTFKNIQNGVGEGNDIFDQATAALVDMSRAMGTDPQAAAIQLGKALNDPIAGISALSRVGVQFTEDQKSVIQSLVETGQTAEAQKIILAELNSQFGGSGAAYAETYAGKVALLGEAWEGFGDAVFSAVMPALGGITEALTGFLNNVATPFVTWLTSGAGDAAGFGAGLDGILGPVSGLIGPVMTLFQAFSPMSIVFDALMQVLPQLADAFGGIASTLSGVLSGALSAVITALAPVVEMLAGTFANTLTLLMPIITQIATTLGSVLGSVLTAISPLITMAAQMFGQLMMAVMPLIDPIIQLVLALLPILDPILQLVGALLTPLIDLLTALLTPILALITPLIDLLAGALGVIIESITGVITVIVDVISWFVSLLTGSQDAADQFNAAWSAVGQWFSDLWNGMVNAAMGAVSGIIASVSGIWDAVTGALSGIGTWLVDSGRALIQGFIDGIAGMVNAVGDAVGGVMDFIGGFFPHSPAERGPFSGSGWRAVHESGVSLRDQFTAGFADGGDLFDSILGAPSVAPAAGMLPAGVTAPGAVYPPGTSGYDGPPIEIHSNDPDLVGMVVADKLRRR